VRGERARRVVEDRREVKCGLHGRSCCCRSGEKMSSEGESLERGSGEGRDEDDDDEAECQTGSIAFSSDVIGHDSGWDCGWAQNTGCKARSTLRTGPSVPPCSEWQRRTGTLLVDRKTISPRTDGRADGRPDPCFRSSLARQLVTGHRNCPPGA
jgi:hypothetical protein